MKRQIYEDQTNTLATSVEVALKEMHESLGSEDFKEGVAHFMEHITFKGTAASEQMLGENDVDKMLGDNPQ